MKQLNQQILDQKLNERFQKDAANGIISGCAAIICQNGSIACEKYFGTTAPEGKQPVTEKTIFRLASMTKPITAVAVMILLARGKLKLNDPVEKYLPAYGSLRLAALDEHNHLTDAGEVSEKVTILHLLTHTSGIGSAEVGERQHALMTAEDNRTLENAVNYFAGQGLAFEPFTAQAYSGLAAFDVLARIVEVITGEDYQAFLQREIFTPCEMKDTTFLPSAEQTGRMIVMHNREASKSVIGETFENCNFCAVPNTHYLGGAGLVSTPRDYMNFAQMLLNRGRFGSRQIIPGELVDLMATAHVPAEIMPGNERWGLGVRVITQEAYRILPVGTFGWSGAFGTHFWVDPVNQVTAVYMKNSLYDGGSGAVTAYHFEEDVFACFTC